MKRKILILAVNPKGTAQLRLDEEARDIQAALERAQYRDQFQLKSQWAVRSKDLRRSLLEFKPHIIHFCGHGEGYPGLALENEAGSVHLVSTEALSGLFKLFADRIECVLLNACYSEVQAKAIAHHIKYVIGMNQAIHDTAAIAFSEGFYDALGANESIENAFKFGCNAVELCDVDDTKSRKFTAIDAEISAITAKMPTHETPVLIKRDEILKSLKETERAAEAKIGQLNQQLAKAEETLKPDFPLQIQEALKWLSDQNYIAKEACRQVFKYNSDVQNLSEDEQDDFRWEIEKYIETVYYSLVAGNLDLLDKPPIRPSINLPDAYKEAFDHVKKIAPKKIDLGAISKISALFDYLFKQIFV